MRKLLMVLSVFLAMSAEARLGETIPEILKRYGAVERREGRGTNEWTGYYRFNGYRIQVEYSGGVSVCETLMTGTERQMSDLELDKLMKSIGGDSGWKKTPLLSHWVNVDSGYVADAVKQAGFHALRVGKKEYLDAKKQASNETAKRAQDRAAEKRTRGF